MNISNAFFKLGTEQVFESSFETYFEAKDKLHEV